MTIRDQLNSFFGIYTEKYCEDNGLFLAYNTKGNLEYKTRAILKPQQQVVQTDLDFTLGSWQKFTNEDEDKATEITKYLKDLGFFSEIMPIFILQGMIIGVSALKVGIDEKGDPRIGFISLYNHELKPIYESGVIVQWELKYSRKNGEDTQDIREVYSKDFYEKSVDGTVEKRVPNKYKKFWIFPVKNSVDIAASDEFTGLSEWSEINTLVDTMNSIQSRLDRIEDIYADPHFIIKGATTSELKREQKAWLVPNPEAEIKILEFQGNAMNSMLARWEKLEKSLKTLAPELMLMELGTLSGESRRQMLQKIEKKINRIRNTYFPVLKNVANLIYEMMNGTAIDFDFETEVVIPTDRETVLKEGLALTGAGVMSFHTFAAKMGYNYEEEQALIAQEVVNDEIPDDPE